MKNQAQQFNVQKPHVSVFLLKKFLSLLSILISCTATAAAQKKSHKETLETERKLLANKTQTHACD